MTQPGALVARTVVDGRYELDARLDDWGLGDAWRARDANFTMRAVVLKVLPALDTQDTEAHAQFTQHARALRSLRHDNVLPLVNQGVWASRPYLVHDLASGTSLARGLADARAAGTRLPVSLVGQLFTLVCAGVSAAHEAPRPLTHGRLNPSSIRVDRAGDRYDVRVVDFGLGALLGTDPSVATALRSYAAPEVRGGAEDTPMADVFSLGMILVEMLTAGPRAGDADPLLAAVVQDGKSIPHAVQSLRDDVPAAVWEAVSQAVRPDPRARFPHAAALRDALRTAWTDRPVRQRVATAPAPAVAPTPAVVPAAVPGSAVPASAPPPLTDAVVRRPTMAPVSPRQPVGQNPGHGPSLTAAPSPLPAAEAPRALGVLPSVVPDLLGPTPRAAVAVTPAVAVSEGSSWEQHTDVARAASRPDAATADGGGDTHEVLAPPGAPEPADPATRAVLAPPPGDFEGVTSPPRPDERERTTVLETSDPPRPDERERTTVHTATGDADDLRATTPVFRAIDYPIPVSTAAVSQPPGVSVPPGGLSNSGVLRSFDNVVGRLSSADDWSAPSGNPPPPSRPPTMPPGMGPGVQGYRPPGAPPGVLLTGVPGEAPWVDRRARTEALVAATPRRPRRMLPWLVAGAMVLVALGIAGVLVFAH